MAIRTSNDSPLLPQFLLLKGLSLASLHEHADASNTFLLGLKLAPYDNDLNIHFHISLKAVKQQYHSYSKNVTLCDCWCRAV